MDEINQYLLCIQGKLNSNNFPTNEDFAKSNYEYAQMLSAVGSFHEALKYYEIAYSKMASVKTSEIWKSMYCSIGVQYASILDYEGKIEDANTIFEDIILINPKGVHIGDYALFLHRRKRQFDQAEKLYLEALDLYPHHSSIHLKYAGFLRHVRRDLFKAEKYYIQAITESPKNADALGSYASFLHGVQNKINEAEKYYQQAIESDQTHANNLCNYGLFLSEELKKYDEAEDLYKKVLMINENHTNTLYNYAVMLDTHVKRKEEAELYYRRAIAIETRHAFALYNLAVLLEERFTNITLKNKDDNDNINTTSTSRISSTSTVLNSLNTNNNDDSSIINKAVDDKKEILHLYERAVEADPKDSTTLADYGRWILLTKYSSYYRLMLSLYRFLLVRMDNPAKSEYILENALKLNHDCEIALFHLAVIHQKKLDLKSSEKLLRKLLTLSPFHGAGILQLARVLSELHGQRTNNSELTTSTQIEIIIEEICSLYESYIDGATDVKKYLYKPYSIMTEYLKLIDRAGSLRQKARTVSNMEMLVNRKTTDIVHKLLDKIKSSL